MKDLKRKIHYWCSDTMQNKITGKGVVCAVLDTGITQHPDLVGRIVGWKDCVQGKKTIYDDNGHGTHVAGILAGNGKSGRGLYSGMAPEAQIFAVKVLNQRGGGKIRDVINGIRYVLLKQKEMKIRIVNISIGTLPHKKDPEDELFLFWVVTIRKQIRLCTLRCHLEKGLVIFGNNQRNVYTESVRTDHVSTITYW